MKKGLTRLTSALVVILLAGCTSDYIMTTRTGEIIETHGKPEIDTGTGMTKYTDMHGEIRQINTSEVSQLMQKD
jgi:hypothetical protein